MSSTSEFGDIQNDLHEHPALSSNFRLRTPVLKDVIKQALFKISMKQTGVIFYGPPRVGKTRCFKALRVEIPRHHKNAYVISMIAVARENARHVSTIVNQLILKEEVEPPRYSSSVKVFNILVDIIIRKMKAQSKNHLVLLFDELQRFGVADFYQLADMVNELDDRGIKVTVISFGMPELKDLAKKFKSIEQLQIVSRFMSNLRSLSGVTSKESLKYILGLYDSDMFYPENSGISYTQHFFPNSFAAGWRLSSLADVIWGEMHKVATGAYVKNFPMEHVSTVVRYFYQVGSISDSEAEPITSQDIQDAINISGFREFCVAVEEGVYEA